MSILAQLLSDAAGTSRIITSGGDLHVADVVDTGLKAGLGHETRAAVVLRDQAMLIQALIAMDGGVEAILLLHPGLGSEGIRNALRSCTCNLFLSDLGATELPSENKWTRLESILNSKRLGTSVETRWLLATSGTTGTPKIISHTLTSLARAIRRFDTPKEEMGQIVWGLTYDLRRFAGIQVLLQALLTGSNLIILDQRTTYASQLLMLTEHGCTHLSATPTYWRQLLMCPGHTELPLRQATLGGEIADRNILTALKASFPHARISHIYASTEVGVGFSVTDGRPGFPASFLIAPPGGTELKIIDDILWLKPPGSMRIKANNAEGVEIDEEGFIKTGDKVRLENGRVQFLGRESGVINVGGVKTYPEVVEAVIRSVPGVSSVRVSGKPSPFMGEIVVADVVLAHDADAVAVRQNLRAQCSSQLGREAVPAIVRFVEELQLGSTGKLVRDRRGV